jgi:hypothetical protein
LNDDDTLKVTPAAPDDMLNKLMVKQPLFDNEWFNEGLLENTSDDELGDSEAYFRPNNLTGYPCAGVWDDLDKNREPYSVWDLMTGSELKKLKKETGVELSVQLVGKLVHIGGHSEEAVCKAREKLSVMLEIKVSSCQPFMLINCWY